MVRLYENDYDAEFSCALYTAGELLCVSKAFVTKTENTLLRNGILQEITKDNDLSNYDDEDLLDMIHFGPKSLSLVRLANSIYIGEIGKSAETLSVDTTDNDANVNSTSDMTFSEELLAEVKHISAEIQIFANKIDELEKSINTFQTENSKLRKLVELYDFGITYHLSEADGLVWSEQLYQLRKDLGISDLSIFNTNTMKNREIHNE